MTIKIKPTSTTATIEHNDSTILTVDSSGNITPSNNLYPKVPTMRVRRNANQSISAQTFTKVQFNEETFDTSDDWDATNYRYTPSVAGYYRVNFQLQTNASSIVGYGVLYKNGSGTRVYTNYYSGTGANTITNGTDIIYLNGSTDYIELYALSSGASNVSNHTFFSANLVSV